MSLHTGKQIHGYKWDELPIYEYIVAQVEVLAEEERQPIIHKAFLTLNGPQENPLRMIRMQNKKEYWI